MDAELYRWNSINREAVQDGKRVREIFLIFQEYKGCQHVLILRAFCAHQFLELFFGIEERECCYIWGIS